MFNRSLPKLGRLQFFFDRSNYTVAPGDTTTVSLFIQETFNPRTDESLLAPGTDGLVSAGVVVQVGVPVRTRPTLVRTPAVIAGSAEFDLAVVALMPTPERPTSVGVLEFSDHPVFGEVVARSPSCETVLLRLGSFTFAASEMPGEMNLLNALATEDFAGCVDENNVTDSGIVLDPLIRPGNAMIMVSSKAPKAGKPRSVADVVASMYDDGKRTH